MHQPPVLPLTEENLLNLSSNNNEMLERYCQEMTLERVRCQSTPPQLTTQQQQHKNNDIVVASPRLLPFPYHNDSMFLPTAEQIQYQMASSCYDNFSSSGTSRADSSSSIIPPSPSFMSRPKRPQSTNTNIRGSSSVSSISHHHHHHQQHRGRRSLPARLDSLVMTNSLCKHRFLRRSPSCSSFGSSSVSSLEVVENNYAHQQQQQQQQSVQPQPHLSHTKKPWLKRIFKFFNKNTNKQSSPPPPQQHQDGNPVWYCQYSKNPTSRFEKYYNQKQMIIVS